MAVLNYSNTAATPPDTQVSMPSDCAYMRNEFHDWLVSGNAKKYSLEVILSCMDRASEYAIHEKISTISIWEYTNRTAFNTLYNKLVGEKLFRITDRNAHKVFVSAGQSYMRFLKEKPFAHKNPIIANREKKEDESEIQIYARVHAPSDFVSWLIKQKNANGTLYLEKVARQYAQYLKSAPPKLDISLSMKERDVFICSTAKEFDELYDIFLAAPNFKAVNGNGHQSFSAGLKAYRRYLVSSEAQEKMIKDTGTGRPIIGTVSTESAGQINKEIRRVDFNHTELCANCNPVTCTVNGMNIPVGTWRDLLILLVEKFVVDHPDRIDFLSSHALERDGARSFLLAEKPKYASRQISTGYWVYLNLSIPDIADRIGKLCQYCGILLNDVEITYAPKSSFRGCNMGNDTSSIYASRSIRAEFKLWLTEQHSDWSPNTVTMHYSDAYYLYNNDRSISLAEALNSGDGEQQAFAAIEQYFTDNPTKANNPAGSAKGYLRSMQMLKTFLAEQHPELLKSGVVTSNRIVPEAVINVLTTDYANGFRFDATTIRLLSDKAQVVIDDYLQSALKRMMFCRGDDVYFWPDVIVDTETQRKITDFASRWLDEYGFFEISELYAQFANRINRHCVDSLENFSAFYEFINKRYVRCVEHYQTRIARINKSVKELSANIASQIIVLAHDKYFGTIEEDVLREHYPAFSPGLLASIIKEHAEELVKTEINGVVCYQTLDALGLSDEFSDTLAEVLEQLESLNLVPSEEVLHTALSIRLGVNFKEEYNIPDNKTYCRIIETYYKNAPKRKWLRGIFAEVTD